MGVLFAILLFFHVLVCILLVLIILMQRPKQEGLGAAFAAGMMHDSFGAQTTDVLQKGTRTLAIAFFVLSISLAVIKAQEHRTLKDHSPASDAAMAVPAGEGTKAPEPGAAPAKETPAPVPEKPAKVEEKPAPAADKPATAPEKPAPAPEKPIPAPAAKPANTAPAQPNAGAAEKVPETKGAAAKPAPEAPESKANPAPEKTR